MNHETFVMDDGQQTVTEDRRQWRRFLGEAVDVRLAQDMGEPLPAEMLDESFGGIGLLLDDAQPLAVGQELDVLYNGTPIRAVVRYVGLSENGRHRVGLEWLGMKRGHLAESLQLPRAETDSYSTLAGEQPIADAIRQFVGEMGGGMTKLRAFFAHARWQDLSRAVLDLEIEAQALGFDGLASLAEHVRAALPAAPLEPALDALIEACGRVRCGVVAE